MHAPYGSKGSGGDKRRQRKSSVTFVLTLIHQEPTVFLIKQQEMLKIPFPLHSRLLQRGRSGALQSLPSPLLCQLLSFPTLQGTHLQNKQSCDLLQATDSSLIFNREFQKLRFNPVPERKRVEVEKIFTKWNALSLPYCTWDARKSSLQRGKRKGSILCSTDACSRGDSDWHWPFQLFQK